MLGGGAYALTLPEQADQNVATVPRARLVALLNRGHMFLLEDPHAVIDEIVRAVEGPVGGWAGWAGWAG